MSKPKAPTIRIPLDKAKHILLAKAIEEHAKDQWSPSDASLLSVRVAHSLGEGATADRFLCERADRLLESAAEKGLAVEIGSESAIARLIGLVFVLAAFVFGALSDRFTGSDHYINLLSVPFWGVILWNLLAYLLIALGAIGLFGKFGSFTLSLRGALLSLLQKCSANPFSRGYKAAFIESWIRFTAPLAKIRVARLLHLAAICFALGLIASLLLRGLSTAYWAGWESTWLADRPDVIKAFLDHTYGLIPAMGSLPAMPDLSAVSAMRADMLPYAKQASTAAPWLIRMILLLVAVVIAPRLILVLFDSCRLRASTGNSRLEISSPYYQALLAESAQNAAVGPMHILVSDRASETSTDFLTRVAGAWGEAGPDALIRINLADPETSLPEIKLEEKALAVLVLEGASTPEEDVHGVIVDAAQKISHEQGARLLGLLNMSAFASRQRAYPERITQRQNNWMKFAGGHSIALIPFDAAQSDPSEVIKALRTQAAALSTSTDQISKDS